MLSPELARFNDALELFNGKFPRKSWTPKLKNKLISDFTFFSSRIEDENLEYGDTIKFLNGELVRKNNLKSLLEVNNHKEVLENFLTHYNEFELSEERIKAIHKDLMQDELSWDGAFKPHLVGNYRNYPVVGYRGPDLPAKEYVPHYNLEISIASHLDIFIQKFNSVDNSNADSHLITALAYFHNKFLNEIHPFADGNGRVCRIIMGIVMMKNGCPPVFTQIIDHDDMVNYINIIIDCEKQQSDLPLVRFLATGLAAYMEKKSLHL